MRILVTGGAGFIGSNYIHFLLENQPDDRVVNLDNLTYAGNPANLARWEGNSRYAFVRGDIAEPDDVERAFALGIDAVVNFAAESHVDRSITDPGAFVRTNVLGTQVLLDAARHRKVSRYVQVSTDEVYGSLGPTGLFRETTPLAPSSPYSASKTSADLLVRAYFHTYGMPVLVTRCSNNYGPYQFPEKLIPLFITNALNDRPVPLYGDGQNVRDWLYVEDHCRAIDRVLRKGKEGEVYNIGGNSERRNREIAELLLDLLGKPHALIRKVTDRPGHDLRYAIDASKIRADLGWEPAHTFETGIRRTVDWYKANEAWWRPLRKMQPQEKELK